jgi:hypothetical protein
MHVISLHFYKLVLFAFLSLADLILTWQLLQLSGGRIYESNPIANIFLTNFGWLGLVIFKLEIVVLVEFLAVLISRYRPAIGGRILAFGCLTLTAVVLYSSSLLGKV